MNKFERVSELEWNRAMKDFAQSTDINKLSSWPVKWDEIKLPQRATKGSAGYDFFATAGFVLSPGETIKLPTGIKCMLDDYRFLMIVPRSSLGFKYRMQLDNSVGIVDADYYNNPSNEGHIYIKVTNDGKEGKVINLNAGDAFAQGIILNYDVTIDNEVTTVRTGGFGSTSGI